MAKKKEKPSYSEKKVQKILRLKRQGHSAEELNKKFGVSQSTIYSWEKKSKTDDVPKIRKKTKRLAPSKNGIELPDNDIGLRKMLGDMLVDAFLKGDIKIQGEIEI